VSVTRVFVARLVNCPVFDPDGDRIGRVRDIVAVRRSGAALRVESLIVESRGQRDASVPIEDVQSIGSGQIIVENGLDSPDTEHRGGSLRVFAELLGRRVTFDDGSGSGTIEDARMESDDAGEWTITEYFVRLPRVGMNFFGKGPTRFAAWDAVSFADGEGDEDASNFLAAHADARPSDLATDLLDLPSPRMLEIVSQMSEERLADVLEEMHEDDQVAIIERLDEDYAAAVLDSMEPNDAADLIGRLGQEKSEALLRRMDPDEADDVRMLLEYAPDTAGGLMTTDPVILSSDATVAEALVLIRRKEVSSALATTVFVTLSPYEPPTGRYLGLVHFQKLLRVAPHERLDAIIDRETEPVLTTTKDDEVARILASYDLVAVPVIDEEHRLVGVITVDDVLDHILPEHWRSRDDEGVVVPSRVSRRAASAASAAFASGAAAASPGAARGVTVRRPATKKVEPKEPNGRSE